MKRLFITRLFLYAAAVIVPMYHPAVAVAYDNVSRFAWFFTVPAVMTVAFFLRPPRFGWWTGTIASALVILGSMLLKTGFERSALLFIVAGTIAFVATHLVFSIGERGRTAAILEALALGAVYYKLLSFARASEDTSVESSTWSAALPILAVAAFLLHAIVLYLTGFPDRSGKQKRREFAAFALAGIPLLALLAFLLPADFVKNRIPLNEWNEEPPERPRELDKDGSLEKERGGRNPKDEDHRRNGLPLGDRNEKYPSELQKDGGARNQSEGEKNRNSQGGNKDQDKGQENQGGKKKDGSGSKQGSNLDKDSKGKSRSTKNKLKGMPSKDWNKDQKHQSDGEAGNQMAVMVVASPVDPVYAAEAYWGDFDPSKGFQVSKGDKLNALGRQRLIERWQDGPNADAGRQPIEVFYMSTIDDRVIAYRPFTIEPTIQDRRYRPFNLSYRAMSRFSFTGPDQWKEITDLNPSDRAALSTYLEINLTPADRAVWDRQTTAALKGEKAYFARIEKILKSLGRFQYEMGFDEDTTTTKMTKFIQSGRTGDCTEFSHSVALMGRLAGIPSRVVTGYLASHDLQTPAHRKGLMLLRQRIPPLQKYPTDKLYLVTTSHHHAWVQFYMPGYGWIDFETTSYAIPPEPKMDPNSMDVVIPVIEEEQLAPEPTVFNFPFRLFLKGAGALVAIVLFGLYAFRYGREAYLRILTRTPNPAGVRAMFTLLLVRLAAEGYALKGHHETPLEFSREHPELEKAAEICTMLRYRMNIDPLEREEAWAALRSQSRQVIELKSRRGVLGFVRRLLSLRGLYY